MKYTNEHIVVGLMYHNPTSTHNFKIHRITGLRCELLIQRKGEGAFINELGIVDISILVEYLNNGERILINNQIHYEIY